MKGFQWFIIIVCTISLIIMAGLSIGRPFDKVSNMREITTTVTGKTVKNESESSKYLVFTKDEEGTIAVFEVTDSLLYGRFNSSDVYADIEEGRTYRFTVGGSRVRIFSWYPNIYEYELIKEGN